MAPGAKRDQRASELAYVTDCLHHLNSCIPLFSEENELGFFSDKH
jgi:hypothetical protein